MSTSEDEEATERTAVRTYVPRYQKEAWAEAAEGRDMSLSEYVRTMTQAGRHGFGEIGSADADTSGSESSDDRSEDASPEEPGPGAVTPGGEALETVLLEALREEPRTYDELVDLAIGDVRESVADEVHDTIQSLQKENRVTHDPRANAYTVIDDE